MTFPILVDASPPREETKNQPIRMMMEDRNTVRRAKMHA